MLRYPRLMLEAKDQLCPICHDTGVADYLNFEDLIELQLVNEEYKFRKSIVRDICICMFKQLN